MRLSPSFDNSVVDYSPRPSIPLEPVDLAGKNEVKTVYPLHPTLNQPLKKTDTQVSQIHQPVDVTSFFSQSVQPKASKPTLSTPQVKVQVVQMAPPKKPVPVKVTLKPPPPKPAVQEVKPQPVEVKHIPVEVKPTPLPEKPKPIPVPVKVEPKPEPSPVAAPKPVEVKTEPKPEPKPAPVETPKPPPVAKEVKPQPVEVEAKPEPKPEPKPAPVPVKPIQPPVLLQEDQQKKQQEEAKNKLIQEVLMGKPKEVEKQPEPEPKELPKPIEPKEEAYTKVMKSVQKPTPTPIHFAPPPKKPALPPQPSPDIQATRLQAEKMQRQIDDIQLSIAQELKKISPAPAPVPITPPQPEPKTQFTEMPSFIKPAEQKGKIIPDSDKKLQEAVAALSTPSPLPPAVKVSPPSKPVETPKTEPTITAVHYWDYFLIRVNPKLNPYKSQIRGRIILAVKIVGMILLVLALIILSEIFTTGFSLNVLFEAFSAFALSGILLFLGENLNMFFEPINPYKIREVT